MLHIEIIRSAQGLEPFRGAWDCLYRDGGYSIFQSPEWNLLAARVFGVRSEPFVIRAESDSGAAIIPACFNDGHICLLGDELFDYRDTLAMGDTEVLRRAWQEVATARRPLSITAVRGERSRGKWEDLGFAPSPFCKAPGVRRAAISADEVSARHTRSARLLRRLAHEGVAVKLHPGSETGLVRHIYVAKACQPIPGNLFRDPLRIDFMVAAAAMDSRCEIFTLETAGTLVAALLTLRDDHVRHFYTTYFDPAWAHYSPGTALIFEVTRRSLEQALDCDYMTGEQPHKTRFATCLSPLFRVEAQPVDLAHVCRARVPFEHRPVSPQIAA
jgi:CelD/BcsL family acetyltransferase involved in cellulose biosynthesis